MYQEGNLKVDGTPEPLHKLPVTMQLCGHDHQLFEDAERCSFGGGYVYGNAESKLWLVGDPTD